MIPIRRKFISVLIALACLCLCFSGCRSLIQPSRRTLAEMNSFLGGSARIEIVLEMVDQDFAMVYESTVLADSQQSQWSGKATVLFLDTLFVQDCVTHTSEGISLKQYRGMWVETDTSSPVPEILSWQAMAAEGGGDYEKKPVPLADYGTPFSEDPDAQCFRITLEDVTLNWNSLCDVALDSMFGGNERLNAITDGRVELLYDVDTLSLAGVIVSYEDADTRMSLRMAVTADSEVLTLELGTYQTVEGYPEEEWAIRTDEAADDEE